MIDPTIETLISAATDADGNRHTDDYLVSPPDPDPDRFALAATKLHDALVSGFEPEFSPQEAEAAGAFPEDALSEADAREVDAALLRFHAGLLPPQA
jgi:hypothetical protein